MNKKRYTKNRVTIPIIRKFTLRIVLITILFTIIIITSSVNVSALGIAPSKKIIDYTPDEITITSRVINNNAQNLAVKITVNGDLEKYVTIDKPTVYIDSSESEKAFNYTLRLPDEIMPGAHELDIVISEFRGNLTSSNSVGGLLAVTQQLIINAEYVGLYSDGSVSVKSTESNDPIITTLQFDNKGTEVIESLTGTINIKDVYGNIVATKNMTEKNVILPKEIVYIEDSMKLKNPGSYIAEYNIDYDGQSMTISKEFSSGEYNIKVVTADVKNFKLGTTAKFDIGVSNSWNVPINDVYGEIILLDTNNTVIGVSNITKGQIKPSKDSMTAYWDTANIKAGEYLLKVNLYVGDKIISQEYKSVIKEDTINLEQISANSGLQETRYYLVTSAVLIILTIVLLILLFKDTKKHKPYK